MRQIVIIIILVNIGLLASCQSNLKPSKDVFYSRKGGIDFVRIPLIKPYEAIKLNGSKEWIMNLKSTTLQFSVSNIKQVTVVDNYIFLYCTHTFLRGSDVKQAWFIIDLSKKGEFGFDSKNEYSKFILKKRYKNTPQLHNIDSVYLEYNRADRINWLKKY